MNLGFLGRILNPIFSKPKANAFLKHAKNVLINKFGTV